MTEALLKHYWTKTIPGQQEIFLVLNTYTQRRKENNRNIIAMLNSIHIVMIP